MRLKDKLIRRNCPVCEEEITLGTSSLNKKINCPKCRQTVIIPDGGNSLAPAIPQKAVAKKSTPKEKRRTRPVPAIRDSPEPLPEPRIFIESFHAGETPPAFPAPFVQKVVQEEEEPVETVESMGTVVPDTGKHDVVYCLCHGILTRRPDSAICSFAPATCCIYANQPGS